MSNIDQNRVEKGERPVSPPPPPPIQNPQKVENLREDGEVVSPPPPPNRNRR